MAKASIRVIGFLILVSLAVFLALGRTSQTRTSAPGATYEYKVEMVKHKQELDQRLKENSRNGWRIQSIVAMPSDNELVVVLERPVAPVAIEH
jgi:hypothetical protein